MSLHSTKLTKTYSFYIKYQKIIPKRNSRKNLKTLLDKKSQANQGEFKK